MKKIVVLLIITCVSSMVFSQTSKQLPDELWGLNFGQTNIDKARDILVEHGLKITKINSTTILSEGEFVIGGFNYYAATCIFANNKLSVLMLIGACEDTDEVHSLFEKQFPSIMGLKDDEEDALRQLTGMTDCDILASIQEEKGYIYCLFTKKGSEAFVLCYMWTKAVEEIVDSGASFDTGVVGEEDVTKFMGIPVDGTYEEMRSKLIGKGFQPSKIAGEDVLTGVFNGEEVLVSIVMNSDKVYRIAVIDRYPRNQGDIIIRYNNLYTQFLKGGKYFPIRSVEINRTENIGYEMRYNNKRYQMEFVQKNESFDSALEAIKMYVLGEAKKHFSQYDIEHNYENKVVPFMQKKVIEIITERSWNTSVWFTILSKSYDNYNVVIYYENPRNMANGEDL